MLVWMWSGQGHNFNACQRCSCSATYDTANNTYMVYADLELENEV